MTPHPPSNPMTHDELLELAALDALAMLDEYETALFNRSFHLATPAVQDEIKDLQAVVASNPPGVADVSAPSSLRQRVLDAVARTADAESQDLAPLAAIGRGSARPNHENRARPRNIAAPVQAWRAAAFLLAATLLVGMYFGLELINSNNQMVKAITKQTDEYQLNELVGSPDIRSFINDPTARQIVMQPVTNDAGETIPVVGYLIINEGESRDACLIVVGLDDQGEFRLVARAEDGSIAHELVFSSSDGLQGIRLGELLPAALAAVTWEVADLSGTLLLRSI